MDIFGMFFTNFYQCNGLVFEVLPYLTYSVTSILFSRFRTMAVEREGRVMIQRGRTRSLHRLTEVSALCQPNLFFYFKKKRIVTELRDHLLIHAL